jgi:hypothetical protein
MPGKFIEKIKIFLKCPGYNIDWKESSIKGKNFSYKETLSVRGVKKIGKLKGFSEKT